MSWSTMLTAFALVFVSELGDKTQIAALLLAGKTSSPWSVFIGATIALILITGLAVLVGSGLAKLVPEKWINIGSSVLFIGIGIFIFIKEVI